MHTGTVTSKGQITIPAAFRQELNIKNGTPVTFRPGEGKNEIIMRVKTGSIKDLAGIIPKPKKPVTIEEMNRAIAQMGRMNDGRP